MTGGRIARSSRRIAVLASAMVLGTMLAAGAAEMPRGVNTMNGRASADELRAALQALGFSEVSPVDRQGNVYITRAVWESHWVDLRIDAATGGISNRNRETIRYTTNMPDDELRAALATRGYTDVGAIKREGNIVTVAATRDSRPMTLKIDARTGGIYSAPAEHSTIQTPRANMSADELRERLQPLGYSDVRGVQSEGNIISLDALKGGEWMPMKIDARNGEVMVAR
jgi:uncharacterized protein (DUF1697 family)